LREAPFADVLHQPDAPGVVAKTQTLINTTPAERRERTRAIASLEPPERHA